MGFFFSSLHSCTMQCELTPPRIAVPVLGSPPSLGNLILASRFAAAALILLLLWMGEMSLSCQGCGRALHSKAKAMGWRRPRGSSGAGPQPVQTPSSSRPCPACSLAAGKRIWAGSASRAMPCLMNLNGSHR